MLSKAIFRIYSYLIYYIKAQSILYIHSPFIYQWYKNLQNPIDEYTKLVISIYEKTLRQDHTLFELQAEGKSTSIKKRYQQTKTSSSGGRLLYQTVRYLQANNALELGTSLGVSSLYMTSASNLEKLTTIDRESYHHKWMKEHFPEKIKEKLYMVSKIFEDALDEVLEINPSFDLVFIDGDHSYEGTLKYVNKIIPFLSENSVMVLDDIRWSSDMMKAWLEVIQLSAFSYTVDMGRYGFLFKLNNKAPKQNFILR